MITKLLLLNETILLQADNDSVVVTNFRLRHTDIRFSKVHISSMFLEKISSIELHHKRNLGLIILVMASLAIGIFAGINNETELLLTSVGFGILFSILYALLVTYQLTIVSDGGSKICFSTKGMKQEKVLEFVNKLESAIKERRDELKSVN